MNLIEMYQKLGMKQKQETYCKILRSKEIFKRLSVALEEVKPGDTSADVLNKIGQIICSLYL